MVETTWRRRLEAVGAVESGHFLLSSGRHSGGYVQCARLLERPLAAEEAGRALAGRLAEESIARIVSPPLGALLIGHEVARSLGVGLVYPERTVDGPLALRRGFRVEAGERVAIVEDVITSGRTTGEVIDLLEERGVVVVAVAAIVDRSDDHAVRGRPVVSLLRLSIPTYPPDTCPLCADGVPLTHPGSRQMKGGRS